MTGPLSLREIQWDDFKSLPLEQKARHYTVEGLPYHTLIAQQFDRKFLDDLGNLTTHIRLIAKSKAGSDFLQDQLCHKRAMLYFTQPSSRTFLSFASACQILGMPIAEVRDTSTSSEFKGETQEDSIRTFSSYFDLIIMRSHRGGLAEKMAWSLAHSERPVPIINAGSGADQHPTQALLDIYTLQRSFEKRGGIPGKTIVFVGDLLRGRTVRSLSCLLAQYPGVKQIFVAPDSLQISSDIQDMLRADGHEFVLTDDMSSVLPEADAVYMTRIQDEWDKEGESYDLTNFHFTGSHLKLLKPDGIIMHPLPRRKEISTDVDQDPRAKYWRQMRNGMWIRAALIAVTFGCRDDILNYT
jgi:aspartate carbamoyltransferase catalytic subunit